MHLFLLLAAAAVAQPTPAPDTYPTSKGTVGVSFFLPAGGADSRLVGATYFIADDLAVRADLGLDLKLSPSGAGQAKLFTLSAGLRSYVVKRNRVGVFLQPGAAIGNELSPAVAADTALFLRLSGAVGVEYFFTPHFSAGATLELALKLANLAGPGGTSVYTTLGTDTSTLSVNIYF
jgi:hypothetical protein